MVTIENLEVRFDVEGEGDEATFGRLFLRNIRRWSREEAEAKVRKRDADRERRLDEAPDAESAS